MSERRRDARMLAAAMAKHKAEQRASYVDKVRVARRVIRRKMREAGLPGPSPRKLKQLVARTLAATGDPQPRQQAVSLGLGMQQIVDRIKAEHETP